MTATTVTLVTTNCALSRARPQGAAFRWSAGGNDFVSGRVVGRAEQGAENPAPAAALCPQRLKGDSFNGPQSAGRKAMPDPSNSWRKGQEELAAKLPYTSCEPTFFFCEHLFMMAERSRVRRSSGSSYRVESR